MNTQTFTKKFIDYKKNNVMVISIILIIFVALFLLTTCVFSSNSSFSSNFVDNWKKTMQMIMSGIALGVSNYLLQRLTRNKLCDSSILGFGNFSLIPISLLCIFTNFSLDPNSNKLAIDQYNILVPFIIILSSVVICLLFTYASKEWFKINLKKMLIAGIILNFISVAIAFSIIAFANPRANLEIQHFAIGYISSNITDVNFYVSISFILFGLIVIMILNKKINIILINQEIAKQVGINNFSVITIMMICIGLMLGGSYSMSGDFVFVGLIAANIASGLHKKSLAESITISGLIGAIMILITYFIFFNLINAPNHIIAPLIPIFITPYFLYTIIRRK